MRNMLLALAALVVAVVFSGVVIADEQAAPSVLQDTAEVAAPVAQPAADAVVEEAAPQQHAHRHYHRRPAKQQNVLQRLWEMEKRKNAWLVRTFFGR